MKNKFVLGEVLCAKKEGNIINPNDIYILQSNESIKDKEENNNKNNEKKEEEELNKDYEHEKNMRNIYNFLINKKFNISNEFIKKNKTEKINLIDNFLVKPKSEYNIYRFLFHHHLINFLY